MGVTKLRLAAALSISRQTVDNYLEIRKHFGMEGLIHGYTPGESKSLRKQREMHGQKRYSGDKTRLVEEIRRKAREEREQKQLTFNFSSGEEVETIDKEEQLFSEEHDWEATRYAGVFTYIIPLITKWKWLKLVMGYFGNLYKIFTIFLFMAASNIRSIEQLKNVRVREAGIVLGICRIPSKPKVWEWFYNAANKQVSQLLALVQFDGNTSFIVNNSHNILIWNNSFTDKFLSITPKATAGTFLVVK